MVITHQIQKHEKNTRSKWDRRKNYNTDSCSNQENKNKKCFFHQGHASIGPCD